jgi:outer membrane protein OmpA-like peptidoglycan-associated protein
MKATEAKTAATSHSLQAKGGEQQPFFQQQEERQGAFFGNEQPAAKPFFTPFIQTKLTIGQPGDQYEQEADAMADKVVQRMADGDQLAGGRSAVGSGARVQRKCAECEQEERLQKKEGEEADAILPKIQKKSIFEGNDERPGGTIQAKSDGALLEASSDLESRLNASRGSGQALPEDTRGSMESAFGADFSSVRVHTGSEAVQMNQELGAQAFTHGSDVYFGAGKYDPGSREGNRLLGHELTHVVQQGGAGLYMQLEKSTPQEIQNKSGTPLVQRVCGPSAAAVGNAGGCTYISSNPVGERALFRVNCNDFRSRAEQDVVEAFADSMTATDVVNVHGFASMDGDLDFNVALSCARAREAADILEQNGIPPAQIHLFAHGPVPGPDRQMRSVVLERDPNVSRPVVPQLTPNILTGPDPGICGAMNFVIQWDLSRNAGAQGGFIVQELTISLFVQDCDGNINVMPFANPLHYFESWRVLPNSTNFDPLDGSTDTFMAAGSPPVGGGCTDGTIVFSGIAHYYDNVPNANMPAHMVRNNPATAAGGLRSSVTDPAIGGNISRPFIHTLSFQWTCCPCQSSPTIVDEHTP